MLALYTAAFLLVLVLLASWIRSRGKQQCCRGLADIIPTLQLDTCCINAGSIHGCIPAGFGTAGQLDPIQGQAAVLQGLGGYSSYT